MASLKTFMGALLAVALAAHAPDALAQAKYPNRPIRLLVPFAPGGGVDVVARVVSQKVSEAIGQPILVESKPGAGGLIAVNELMRSEPDGTTLLMTTSSHATLPTFNHLSWNPSGDFTPIASIYSYMFVMSTPAVNASRFKTFAEFLKYARDNPGKISWGSSGIGGPQHLGGELFARAAGVKMVHVPYRGNGPMLQALLVNDVQLTFDTPTLPLPHILAGRLIALAVTGEKRLPKLPDVPTVKETGLVDFSTGGQIFVLGPKGMPPAMQASLTDAFATALENKDVRDRLTGFGLGVPTKAENTVAALKAHIDNFAATYGKLITEMNIKAE